MRVPHRVEAFSDLIDWYHARFHAVQMLEDLSDDLESALS